MNHLDVPALNASDGILIIRQQARPHRTGGRADRFTHLTKTCPLFSKPIHLVTADNATRTAERLSLEPLSLRARRMFPTRRSAIRRGCDQGQVSGTPS